MTSPNGSRRSSPRSCRHRPDRRCRSAVRLCRRRRPPPQRQPRTAGDPSRSTDRPDAGHHRGRLPARNASGSRARGAVPRRPCRRGVHRRAGCRRRLDAHRRARRPLSRPAAWHRGRLSPCRSRATRHQRDRHVGPSTLRRCTTRPHHSAHPSSIGDRLTAERFRGNRTLRERLSSERGPSPRGPYVLASENRHYRTPGVRSVGLGTAPAISYAAASADCASGRPSLSPTPPRFAHEVATGDGLFDNDCADLMALSDDGLTHDRGAI
jgi:hypothetical protein